MKVCIPPAAWQALTWLPRRRGRHAAGVFAVIIPVVFIVHAVKLLLWGVPCVEGSRAAVRAQ